MELQAGVFGRGSTLRTARGRGTKLLLAVPSQGDLLSADRAFGVRDLVGQWLPDLNPALRS